MDFSSTKDTSGRTSELGLQIYLILQSNAVTSRANEEISKVSTLKYVEILNRHLTPLN